MQENIARNLFRIFAYEINVYFKLPKPVIHDTSIVDNDINMTEFRDRCLKRFCKSNCIVYYIRIALQMKTIYNMRYADRNKSAID